MGYCTEPIFKSDLYPLVCTIISGDVARQHAVNDIANVTVFLQNNAHLQGGPADVMQVQEDATTSLTGRTVETLEQELVEASLTNPDVLMQDPLITWLVQVSRREARKHSAALEIHQKLYHMNASDMHHSFPSLTALQLQAILECSVCAACKMHRRPFKAVPAQRKATRQGAILSMDLSYWPTPSPGGAKHLLVLHDQFSTLIACAPPIRKSEASDVI